MFQDHFFNPRSFPLAICSEPHSGIRICCELFPNSRSDRDSIFHSKKNPRPGFSANFYLLFCKRRRHKDEVTSLFRSIFSICSLEWNAEVDLIATQSNELLASIPILFLLLLFRNIINQMYSQSEVDRPKLGLKATQSNGLLGLLLLLL